MACRIARGESRPHIDRAMHILIRTALLGLLTALAGACSRHGAANDKAGQQKMPPAPVVAGVVVKKAMPLEVRAVGNVEPVASVSVKPQVGGALTELHFTEGQNVRKGDPLFTINPKPYRAALNQAQGKLDQDRAQLKNARLQLERYEALAKTGSASKEQFDLIRSQAEALEAAVRADEAALEVATVQLGYCSVNSPLDGRAGHVLTDVGNVIKVNETPLVQINQIQPIHVAFAVPEQHLPEIRRRLAAGKLEVTAATPAGELLAKGELTFIDNAVNAEAGTILLRGTFANTDETLWPGQFVNVTLTLATQPDALVVPTAAVQTSQKGQFVFVIKPDSTAEMRPIVVDRAVGEHETVIAKGVQPGERVVTDGQLRVIPGAKVEVKTAVPAGSALSADGGKSH